VTLHHSPLQTFPWGWLDPTSQLRRAISPMTSKSAQIIFSSFIINLEVRTLLYVPLTVSYHSHRISLTSVMGDRAERPVPPSQPGLISISSPSIPTTAEALSACPPFASSGSKLPLPVNRSVQRQARNSTGKTRVSQACEPCRHRRTKCNGGHPICLRCESWSITCYYADGKRERNKMSRPMFLVCLLLSLSVM
jgi:hypothetical protein